jgi:hypothetical protein
MTVISEKENGGRNFDFDLGIDGFRFSDLFDAVRLRDLADRFYAEVAEKEPALGDALKKYIAAEGGGFERKAESKILTDAAPFLSDFIARMFRIGAERAALEKEILQQNPIWKFKFFVQRRAVKKFKADEIEKLNENELWLALTELRNAGFDETLRFDEELSIATVTSLLTDAEEIFSKGGEVTDAARDTLERVNKAYGKLKDKTFGRIFSEYVLQATDKSTCFR